MEIYLYDHCRSNKYDSLYQIQDSELDKSTVLPLGLSLCLCHTQYHKKWGVDYSFLMPQMQTMLSSAFQSSNNNVCTLRILYSELICTFLESVSEKCYNRRYFCISSCNKCNFATCSCIFAFIRSSIKETDQNVWLSHSCHNTISRFT